jgi:3-hydroxyacyl-[acyl-carrier-protein] dehydratase
MSTAAQTSTSLPVAADHPAYAGHFPGMPVLPGVVLLDEALHALEQAAGDGVKLRWQVATAKFQSVVRPGEALTLEHQKLPNGSVRFTIRTADRTVASGIFVSSGPQAANPLTGQDSGQQG